MGTSSAGGWDGIGVPEHGDYFRPLPSGNAHITMRSTVTASGLEIVESACGNEYDALMCDPAPEDPARPCARCWAAM